MQVLYHRSSTADAKLMLSPCFLTCKTPIKTVKIPRWKWRIMSPRYDHKILSGRKNLCNKVSFLHVLMRFLKNELDMYIHSPLDSKRDQKHSFRHLSSQNLIKQKTYATSNKLVSCLGITTQNLWDVLRETKVYNYRFNKGVKVICNNLIELKSAKWLHSLFHILFLPLLWYCEFLQHLFLKKKNHIPSFTIKIIL